MSQKAGNTLIIIAIILLNLILMTSGGGRSGDYQEAAQDEYTFTDNEELLP